ncbi:MAG: hypothetical protein K8M05_12005 [Deltaproteobacteria bacterium]|nr:hypothetical protein [Kofleriaceae bacterium]
MKTFLAIYTGTAEKLEQFKQLPEEERSRRETAGVKAWMEWGARHAAAIVDDGAPLGKTKRITSAGIADIRNNIAGYVLVQAESHEAAARLFLEHPHFTIFPGDAVEIMECLPMPV